MLISMDDAEIVHHIYLYIRANNKLLLFTCESDLDSYCNEMNVLWVWMR